MSEERKPISQLIHEAWNKGDPTAWFEQVYARAEAGDANVPWAYMAPNPRLVDWLEQTGLRGDGKQALVIGCGLGDDAEALAEIGFDVTAFDISETAISWCKRRFPISKVNYQQADLFKAPEGWHKHFDFVFESRTIQSLPWQMCEQAMAAIASFVAPDGTLLVICHGRDPKQERQGIPWPLSHDELAHFAAYGLREQAFEDFVDYGARQFRVEYRRDKS